MRREGDSPVIPAGYVDIVDKSSDTETKEDK